MEIWAYLLNIISAACCVAASLLKTKNMTIILFLSSAGNIIAGLSYIIGGNGINGALSCFLGGAIAIINYLFERKNIKIPNWLICIYSAAFVGVNIFVGGINIPTAIAIVACMCYVVAIAQKKPNIYRLWIFGNSLLWCIYDIIAEAYNGLVVHVVILTFSVAGIIINDMIKKKDPK